MAKNDALQRISVGVPVQVIEMLDDLCEWHVRSRSSMIRRLVVLAHRIGEPEINQALVHMMREDCAHAASGERIEFLKKQAAAHTAVSSAIASGELIRPDRCESCGSAASRIIAHHDDYDQPLNVRWLCAGCHLTHHRENGPAKCAV